MLLGSSSAPVLFHFFGSAQSFDPLFSFSALSRLGSAFGLKTFLIVYLRTPLARLLRDWLIAFPESMLPLYSNHMKFTL